MKVQPTLMGELNGKVFHYMFCCQGVLKSRDHALCAQQSQSTLLGPHTHTHTKQVIMCVCVHLCVCVNITHSQERFSFQFSDCTGCPPPPKCRLLNQIFLVVSWFLNASWLWMQRGEMRTSLYLH